MFPYNISLFEYIFANWTIFIALENIELPLIDFYGYVFKVK